MTAWLGHTGACLYTEQPDSNRDFSIFFLIFLTFIYLQRERQSMSEGRAEREGNPEFKAGSRP